MELEARPFDEWRASDELLKSDERSKQGRFAHLLSIQMALPAFSLCRRKALVVPQERTRLPCRPSQAMQTVRHAVA